MRTMIPLVMLLAATAARADTLQRLLSCQDRALIERAPAALAQELSAADAALSCRERVLARGTAMECDSTRDRAALGLATREFGTTHDGSGERAVRIVFRAAPERVRAAAAERLRATFVETGDGARATLAGTPPLQVRVMGREDGSSVLVCAIAPLRDEAEGIALGVDATRGGLAGHLSFPGAGEVMPAMRVCAVPRESFLRARCVMTAAGTRDYLITGLTPGLYDVASFALSGNSNGWVGAHANRLGDCGPNRTDCAGGVLVAVDVRAGTIVTDVDPDRFYTQLPPRFDVVREGDARD